MAGIIRAFGDQSPILGDEVFLADGSVVIGDVILGRRSSVWFNAVIRGDAGKIRIGQQTNIQDGCVVHVTSGKFDTRIGESVTIGHRAVLHGCTIGEVSLIGIGAIVMDGAEIGAESIIGAGSLVAPGSKIPTHSLALGSPARVVRALTEAEVEFLHQSARNYVGYASLYLAAK